MVYFTRAEFDMLEAVLDESIEENQRALVTYNDEVMYFHSLDTDTIVLTTKDAIYFPVEALDETILSAGFVISILNIDAEQVQPIIAQLENPTFVDVYFAEKNDGSVVIFEDKHSIPSQGYTGKFYHYNDGTYEKE